MIEVRPVCTKRERNIFLTFPWQVYKNDPLWVPPLLPERAKRLDPKQNGFFKNGYADFFIAWKAGRPAGTICCAEDLAATKFKGYGECVFGFFECVEDYAVAEALFSKAEQWSREHKLTGMYGQYNLDYEDSRGLLVEGRDRPPAILCGHTPPYYVEFFERSGWQAWNADGLAYAIDIDLNSPKVRRMARLADRIRERRPEIKIRGADLKDIEGEIDRILDLTNRSLAHLAGFTTYPREAIEAIVRPMVSVIDPELALFAEINGEAVGFFPGIPNLNEIFIHVNGLRHPWDYVSLLRYMRTKPKCLAIKSVLVPPEHWDTGVGVLLFDEMAKRASARGYEWADLSITGEDNTDTWPLAHHMGAKIYKRYRLYKKGLATESAESTRNK
jgi:GNAT superfamily N-acetyltransferase